MSRVCEVAAGLASGLLLFTLPALADAIAGLLGPMMSLPLVIALLSAPLIGGAAWLATRE